MATLIRFREPFREIAALQNEMSRLMGGFFDTDGRTNQAWVPAVDVWETDDEIVYAFDLPGIAEDKISVELEDNALTVSGERERTDEVKDDRFYRFERRFGSFSRTIGLPQGTSEDGIGADYKDGVLEIRVRKPEEPKPRRIQVGAASGGATIEGTSTPAES
jgi:HSP20 family protein